MRSPAAERALRRYVARLAAAAPEDVDLILGALEPGQSEAVRTLLAAYGADGLASPPGLRTAGLAEAFPAEPEPAPPGPDLDGLSPGIAERIGAALRGEGDARMTPAAAVALAQVLAETPPDPSLAFQIGRPARRRSGLLAWMGRS